VCYKKPVPYDLLILYGIAAAATAAILIFAYRLSRRYPQDYIGDYFHYLLAAGLLALLGKPLPVLIAGSMRLARGQADQFYVLFDRLAAKPLWILSLFLLLKCVASLVGRRLSRPFLTGYGIFWGGYSLCSGISLVGFFQTGFFSAAGRTFNAVHNYFDVFAVPLIFACGIVLSSRIDETTRRRGARTFCWIGFASKAVFWGLIFLSHSFNIPFLVGVILPVPALLYLAAFLKKSPQSASSQPDYPAALEAFYERFAISPRERDIITQICAGRSNQAIADALFISVHTVKRHVNQIYHKVRVRNRVQLANAVRESSIHKVDRSD
jgi:DNA-binding CsgD family transcriptional regulator